MRGWTVSIFAAIAALSAATTAEAASIPVTMVTPDILFADFNVIAQNSFTNVTDVQGPVLVGCPITGCLSTQGLKSTGGPLNNNNVVLGTTPGTTGINGYGEINVFGNVLTATNAMIAANGSMDVGGNYPANAYIPTGGSSHLGGYPFPPGSTTMDNPGTFKKYIWDPLTSVSTTLSNRMKNSDYMVTATGITFAPGAGVGPGVPAIFTVPVSVLQNLTPGTVTFAGCIGAGTCDTVINLTGGGTLDNTSLVFPFGSFKNILFNFVDATALTVENVWTVTILDPLGSVVGRHEIDGGVIAPTFSTADEVHLPGFDCSDNLCSGTPPNTVPEPASLALLGSTLAGFALIRRRRT